MHIRRAHPLALLLGAGLLALIFAGCCTAKTTSTCPRPARETAAPAPLAFTKVLRGVATIMEAETKVVAALKHQGFGIITRIDAQAIMRKKLGVLMKPYLILGACNPKLAHQAIVADHLMGLLLPCKVVVYQRADGAFVVSLIRAKTMFSLVRDPRLTRIAAQVEARFQKAFDAL